MHTKHPNSPKSLPFPTFGSSPKHLVISHVQFQTALPQHLIMCPTAPGSDPYSPKGDLEGCYRWYLVVLKHLHPRFQAWMLGLRPSWDSPGRSPEKLLPHSLGILDLGSYLRLCLCAPLACGDGHLVGWWPPWWAWEEPGRVLYAPLPHLSVLLCGCADKLLLCNITISWFWCV